MGVAKSHWENRITNSNCLIWDLVREQNIVSKESFTRVNNIDKEGQRRARKVLLRCGVGDQLVG